MKMKNDAERCYNIFLADLSLKMGFYTALTLEFTGPARLFTQVRWNDFLGSLRARPQVLRLCVGGIAYFLTNIEANNIAFIEMDSAI